MNRASHREQHREHAQGYRQVCLDHGHEPTPDGYRNIRRSVAKARRAEQRNARMAIGRDRATLRALKEARVL